MGRLAPVILSALDVYRNDSFFAPALRRTRHRVGLEKVKKLLGKTELCKQFQCLNSALPYIYGLPKGAKLLEQPKRTLLAPNGTSMPPGEPVSQIGLVHLQNGQSATKMTVSHQRCQMASSRTKTLNAPKIESRPLKTKKGLQNSGEMSHECT